MNKNKVADCLKAVAKAFDDHGVSHAEKYAIIANSLILSALDENSKVLGYPELNWKDAFQVERAFIETASTDSNLAAILQAHIILKWATIIEDGLDGQ